MPLGDGVDQLGVDVPTTVVVVDAQVCQAYPLAGQAVQGVAGQLAPLHGGQERSSPGSLSERSMRQESQRLAVEVAQADDVRQQPLVIGAHRCDPHFPRTYLFDRHSGTPDAFGDLSDTECGHFCPRCHPNQLNISSAVSRTQRALGFGGGSHRSCLPQSPRGLSGQPMMAWKRSQGTRAQPPPPARARRSGSIGFGPMALEGVPPGYCLRHLVQGGAHDGAVALFDDLPVLVRVYGRRT